MTETTSIRPNRDSVIFWAGGALLVAYVAILTGQRENAPFADAWEHHRVILALNENLWKPGNPTYASDAPSIRYSPYFVAQALVCRLTGLDAYHVQSGAAVLNTLLLVLAVRAFLRTLGEERSAATALLVMVTLYGGTPGWAGSYALSDLPWHQVNPSAFSLPVVLFVWTLFRKFNAKGWRSGYLILAMPLTAIAMLDHAMTGVFGLVGLYVLAAASTTDHRLRLVGGAVAVTVFVAAASLCWPWYNFLTAVLSNHDPDYWFDQDTLYLSLFAWPAPALLCSLPVFAQWRRETIRVLLVGAAACFALGLASLLLHSALLARLPLPGMLFLHLSAAIFAREAGIFRAATWPARLRGLFRPDSAKPVLETAVAAALIYFLVPQCIEIFRSPYLARAYVAPLFGKEDLQKPLKQRFDALLQPVGPRDVVLSDPKTAWPIPSSRGRIVAALHYEFFVPDEKKRHRDVERFFAFAARDERVDILRRYNVRWIVLNRERLDYYTFTQLLEEKAVVKRLDNLVLMDAAEWIQARLTQNPPLPPSPPESAVDPVSNRISSRASPDMLCETWSGVRLQTGPTHALPVAAGPEAGYPDAPGVRVVVARNPDGFVVLRLNQFDYSQPIDDAVFIPRRVILLIPTSRHPHHILATFIVPRNPAAPRTVTMSGASAITGSNRA